MLKPTSSKRKKKESVQGITGISVRGYKSLYEECSIEVRPLTILAGANSSGKSSIMQPLLLLKQTLEATYDPGALLLDGPHVRFTSAVQLFSQVSKGNRTDSFAIKIEIKNNESITHTFKRPDRQGIELSEMTYKKESETLKFRKDMSGEEIDSIAPEFLKKVRDGILNRIKIPENQSKIKKHWQLDIKRNRCFFELTLNPGDTSLESSSSSLISNSPFKTFAPHIRNLIHVPGLRGNPERTYKTTAIGNEFQGTFEYYVASVVNHWQNNKDKRLKDLGHSLETLGLTCQVEAKPVEDTRVELRVGRLPRSGKGKDMVSIADVGFGVSQTLPVLVALLVAEPGQLVYLEQPEIHLHPRAQVALAEILADAANRGVRVVVETHSELLLVAVQSLVAERKLSPDKVKLHWFTRRENGVTEVSSTDLDEAGAFGDWPEDFSDVSLKLDSRYLDAAESRLAERSHVG